MQHFSLLSQLAAMPGGSVLLHIPAPGLSAKVDVESVKPELEGEEADESVDHENVLGSLSSVRQGGASSTFRSMKPPSVRISRCAFRGFSHKGLRSRGTREEELRPQLKKLGKAYRKRRELAWQEERARELAFSPFVRMKANGGRTT
jgi:hypothetical protein